MRLQMEKAIAFATLVVMIGIGGCGTGNSGGDAARSPGNSGASGVTETASSVTVTYYYLPG